jgi:protoporphyrinogen IX oxidase
MERRLIALMNLAALLALAFGIATLLAVPAWMKAGWLHAKLALVLVLIGYHHACIALARKFREGRNRRSARWLKVFNEMPALLLLGIVILVVVKPF